MLSLDFGYYGTDIRTLEPITEFCRPTVVL